MNYKRKKPRRFARCKLCTPRKYVGNSNQHGRGRQLNGKRLKVREDLKEQLAA